VKKEFIEKIVKVPTEKIVEREVIKVVSSKED
jgi:hypothetical protein